MASLDGLEHPDEDVPLLQGKLKTTPVPWSQISLALLVLISESVSMAFTSPFLNKFIGETGITGGDDRKIGYYSGLAESLVFVTQIFTTWQWSRLSDFAGRRPVLLLGVLSLGLSRFSIGLSTTFGMLVLRHTSRCIGSMLDGNLAVVSSIIGDLTDNTNMAQVFAVWPAIVSVAMGLASFYGGELARPQERWPHIFRGEFWAKYPYFLPSFVTGCFTLSTFFICVIFFKESLPSKAGKRPQVEIPEVEISEETLPTNDARPVSMSALLTTSSVMIRIVNSAMLSLMDVSFSTLLPLFQQSSIKTGGLGLPPHIIGSFAAVSSVVGCFVQVVFTPKLIARFGAKSVLCWATLWMYPVILLSPAMSALATAQGKAGPMVYALWVAQLMCQIVVDLCFTVMFVFITRAAPNKQSLGSVNGLNQSLTSVARIIGALSASLFAFSKQFNVMEGNFVYLILVILATIPVVLSRRLPDLEAEDEHTEEGMPAGAF